MRATVGCSGDPIPRSNSHWPHVNLPEAEAIPHHRLSIENLSAPVSEVTSFVADMDVEIPRIDQFKGGRSLCAWVCLISLACFSDHDR